MRILDKSIIINKSRWNFGEGSAKAVPIATGAKDAVNILRWM
jgi:hypothetical protein